jgi:hypothetical protein
MMLASGDISKLHIVACRPIRRGGTQGNQESYLVGTQFVSKKEGKRLDKEVVAGYYRRTFGALKLEQDAILLTFFRDEEKVSGFYCS